MIEHDSWIEQLPAALGITWKVEQVYGTVDQVLIASSKPDRIHQITLPFTTAPFESFKTDIALALAKAKFR